MEEETKEKQEQTVEAAVERKEEAPEKEPKRKVSKAWEAAQRLKGSVIVNDPTLFYR